MSSARGARDNNRQWWPGAAVENVAELSADGDAARGSVEMEPYDVSEAGQHGVDGPARRCVGGVEQCGQQGWETRRH